MATKPLPPLYTWYLIKGAKGIRPKLIANNGKPTLNEAVTRAAKLERSINRYHRAVQQGRVAVIRISEAQFRKRFPRFPRNAGAPNSAKPTA